MRSFQTVYLSIAGTPDRVTWLAHPGGAQRSFNHRHDLRVRERFLDKPANQPLPESRLNGGIILVEVPRDDQDRNAGVGIANSSRQLQTIHVRQLGVQQEDLNLDLGPLGKLF